jgi:hypothetical protein
MKTLAAIVLIIMGGLYAVSSAEGGIRTGMSEKGTRDGRDAKVLIIKWQRLVDEKGRTCERCGSTEKELKKAFQALKKSLTAMGVKVILEKETLTPAECAEDVSESNRIWLGGRPVEEWLDAEVGKSLCGFCCEALGDGIECRTIKVDGKTYETIPKDLIMRAGLLAASQLFTGSPSRSCCGTPAPAKKSSGGCCPASQTKSCGQ